MTDSGEPGPYDIGVPYVLGGVQKRTRQGKEEKEGERGKEPYRSCGLKESTPRCEIICTLCFSGWTFSLTVALCIFSSERVMSYKHTKLYI